MAEREYQKFKDYSFGRMYQSWNYTTACCYKYKTKCVLCPNQIVCSQFDDEDYMHPIKKATMLTLRNIGTEGLDWYIGKESNEYR